MDAGGAKRTVGVDRHWTTVLGPEEGLDQALWELKRLDFVATGLLRTAFKGKRIYNGTG
jgi:hypothetical protein